MWGGQFSTAAISGSPARESPSSPSGGRLRTGALVGEERDQRFYTGVVPELAEASAACTRTMGSRCRSAARKARASPLARSLLKSGFAPAAMRSLNNARRSELRLGGWLGTRNGLIIL
jgi:hypothetical protein